MSKAYTKRTKDSTIVAFNKKLEKKRIQLEKNNDLMEGYRYIFFYYAVGENITAGNREVLRKNRIIWQNAMLDYINEDSGSISQFLDKIVAYVQKMPLRKTFRLKDKRREKSLAEYRGRYFLQINGSKKIKPEHAIEYHLIHKECQKIGKFIAYEFPLDLKNYFGGIDLIAYNSERKELRLIELKKVNFKESKESCEMFLRAYTEIITYRACFDMLLKNLETRKLLQDELNKLGEELEFKIDLDDVKVINCIFGPESLYEDVDDNLREFVKTTKNESYKVELYSLSVHEEEIMKHPIGHSEIMIEIESYDFH